MFVTPMFIMVLSVAINHEHQDSAVQFFCCCLFALWPRESRLCLLAMETPHFIFNSL